MSKYNLEKDYILDNCMNVSDISGIYFLVDNNEIVYIGQSVSVYSRISQHKGKKFDKWYYIKCNKEELDDLEAHYIVKFKPILNKGLPDNNLFINLISARKKWRDMYGEFYEENIDISKIKNIIPVFSDIYYKREDIEKIGGCIDKKVRDNIIYKLNRKIKKRIYTLYHINRMDIDEVSIKLKNLNKDDISRFLELLKSNSYNYFDNEDKSRILYFHFIEEKSINIISMCANLSEYHISKTISDYLRIFDCY